VIGFVVVVVNALTLLALFSFIWAVLTTAFRSCHRDVF